MNTLSLMLKSFNKSKRIKKIYANLYVKFHDENAHDMAYRIMNMDTSKEEAKHEKATLALMDFIENDVTLIPILEYYNANRDQLREIYNRFCGLGCKTYVAGHLISAAAIAYYLPLNYVLANLKGFYSGENTQEIVYNVTCYFKDGQSDEMMECYHSKSH